MKPKPPADLWALMDKAVQAMPPPTPPRPLNSFTRGEFRKRYGFTEGAAVKRLKILRQLGKIKKVGTRGDGSYYVPCSGLS